MQQYKTQYGTIFAVREYKGHPAIMLRAEHKPDEFVGVEDKRGRK